MRPLIQGGEDRNQGAEPRGLEEDREQCALKVMLGSPFHNLVVSS